MGSIDAYERGKILGKGSFGSAILATRKADGKKFVMKEIDMAKMPTAEREASHQEAKLLKALNHPNIVRANDCFTCGNKLCIVMEWCSEGDLYGLLQKRKGQQVSEETILDWFVQLCLGLKHVHDRKILHRDLKTQNVFVSAGGLLKLGDFGVSKILNSTWQLAATAVGTPYYLSPEICQNKRYNQKSDIWSLGCVLYEITNLRHAFEAPNMRALIQKIIKGQYTPVPTTRSKELRDMIGSMLTLDTAKRPTINDILNTPIMKQRIQRFLSATIQAKEFSHTMIHGKPKAGDIVVGAGGAPGVPLAPPTAQQSPIRVLPSPGANNAHTNVPAAANSSPSKAPQASPSRAPGPPASPCRPPARVASPIGGPSPGARPPAPAAKGAAPTAGHVRASASPSPGKAAPAGLKVVAAAKPVVRKEVDVQRSRELAAMQAGREVERMKLDEQYRMIEMERARQDADRKQSDRSRVEDERKAAAQQLARKAQQKEDDKKSRDEAKKQKEREEEARKKEAAKSAKDKEREDMRAQMAAQKKDYYDRQQAAAKAKVDANGGGAGAALGGGGPPVATKASPVTAQRQRSPAPQRRPWSPVHAPGEDRSAAEVGGLARVANGGPGVPEPTAEQRRAVWEEQKAAAERNRRQADEGGHGGLAAFLGVPEGGQRQANAQRDVGGPSPEQRRQAYTEQQRAAEINRRQVHGDSRPHVSPRQRIDSNESPYERKQRKLEEERKVRERELVEFQKQHWREMRDAAEKNKLQIMRDMVKSPPGRTSTGGEGRRSPYDGLASPSTQPALTADPPPPPSPHQFSPSNRDHRHSRDVLVNESEDTMEFAAMVKDMQDVLGEDAYCPSYLGADSEEDDPLGGDHKALDGNFQMNGEAVLMPVPQDASLAMKVEALRVYLEQKLGVKPFLHVYRRLESLSMDDDEAEVSKEFLRVLGQDNLAYIQLVHQLIVTEEQMN